MTMSVQDKEYFDQRGDVLKSAAVFHGKAVHAANEQR